MLIIEDRLNNHIPLVFSLVDYDQTFDSADRKALVKLLSLHSRPDKCIKVLSAMYDNNIAAETVGNKASSWFRIKSEVEQGCFLSAFIWIILMDHVQKSTAKAMG